MLTFAFDFSEELILRSLKLIIQPFYLLRQEVNLLYLHVEVSTALRLHFDQLLLVVFFHSLHLLIFHLRLAFMLDRRLLQLTDALDHGI